MYIDNHKFHALIDSGSTDNLIHQQVIDQLSLNVISIDSSVSIASIAHVKSVSRYVINNVIFKDRMYDSMKLSVLDDLCVDIILGLSFQTQHNSVKFKFNVNKPPIGICGLLVPNVSSGILELSGTTLYDPKLN